MSNRSCRYLILGGNGVFGVHLARYLLEQEPDAEVACVGRNPHKSKPFSLGLGPEVRRYSYHEINVATEWPKLQELLEELRPDYVVNFAALAADVASSWNHGVAFYETNVVGLVRMVDSLVRARYLKRWLQIGSSEIFGSSDDPSTEGTRLNPSSPYAVSKLAGDLHLKVLHKVVGFPMNILWPSNCYGPGQQLYRIIPRTILACLLGRKIPLQGGGVAVRTYMHAGDLARAIHLVLHRAIPGSCYNVGADRGIAIRDLVELIAQKLGKRLEDVAEIAPDRLGQDAKYLLDSTRIWTELGWRQEIDLDRGLDDTIAWARAHLGELKDLSTEVRFES